MDEESEKNGLGVASLVCGIISISLSIVAIPIGIFSYVWGCVITAIGIGLGIFAIVAGTRSRKYNTPAGKAIAGFILGIIGTSMDGVIFVIYMGFYLFS